MIKSKKNTLVKLSIGASILCSPVIAEENFGWYGTGSIGGTQITEIKYIDTAGNLTGEKVTFDSGLGLDLGFGYDFGSSRIEGT